MVAASASGFDVTDPLRRRDLDILGEPSVYPGHPTVLAYLILKLYEGRLEDAFGRGQQYAKIEEDERIPGAGGHASAGLDVILRVRVGMSIDHSLKWADNTWSACDGQRSGGYPSQDPERMVARWREGQEQADRFRERVVEELRKVAPSPSSPSTRPA